LPLYAFDALLKSNGLEMTQVAYRDFTPAPRPGRRHLDCSAAEPGQDR
jgi:hypothetical protein